MTRGLWKHSLTWISFSHAEIQSDKNYQIKLKPHMIEFKDYYILTSLPEENSVGVKWKLLIPVFSYKLMVNQLNGMSVRYCPQKDMFSFSYVPNDLVVNHVEDLTNFMQVVLGSKNMLVSDLNLQRICHQFESHFMKDNVLIPTFTIKTDGSSFIFHTKKKGIGDEEVPKISSENYAQFKMLTPTLLCKPKLKINGVAYQVAPPSAKLLSTVCEYANKVYTDVQGILNIKEKYETGQKITDEELDPLIKSLESKVMKTLADKQEITRLKDRRRTRQIRKNMSKEQAEAIRKRARERKREMYNNLDEESKEALRKQVREQKKIRYRNMNEEEKEVLRKKVREQKKAKYHQMNADGKDEKRKYENQKSMSNYTQNCEHEDDLWMDVSEEEAEIEYGETDHLGTTCRGCEREMERLVKHLKSKKGEACMAKYTKEEIKKHWQFVQKKKKDKYNRLKKQQKTELWHS